MAVLAVPLAEVDPLVLGLQAGKVSLALRHPGDQGMPSDLLFPLAPTVLAPRSDLTAEQRAWLLTPENRAYRGRRRRGPAGTRTNEHADDPATRTSAEWP